MKNHLIYQDKEYMQIVENLLKHHRVQMMSQYIHHGDTDCLTHSLHVSYMSYRLALKWGMNPAAMARAGLLHDLYLYDWHDKGDRKGLHGFTHAKVSLKNAKELFEISDLEQDIISKHMWPLNPKLPKYKESFIFMLVDRYCTLLETFHKPVIKGG